MHHRHAAPPPSARLRGAVSRRLRIAGHPLRRRTGRLALAALACAVVPATVLGVPVVSGADGEAPAVSLDASSSGASSAPSSPSGSSSASSSARETPVVMGRDGRPGTAPPSATAPVDPGVPAAEPSETGGAVDPEAKTPEASPAPDASAPAVPSATHSSAAVATSAPAARAVVPPDTATAPPPVAEPVTGGAAEQVLQLVNSARTEAGCGSLVADGTLAAEAQEQSTKMRDAGRPGSRSAAGGSLLGRGGRAVTVARGPGDPAAVVGSWLADHQDRAVLLDCGLHSVGIGVAQGSGGTWWTQLLA